MMIYLLRMFGISLFLTLLVEGLVAFLWGLRGKKNLLVVLLVNVLTNPLAVLVYWLYQVYAGVHSLPVQVIIELVVVIVEIYIYRSFAEDDRFQIPRPIGLAIVANVLSWGIGRLI